MADKKVSSLDSMVVFEANDAMLIIDVGGTPTGKKTTLKEFSRKALCNTVINGTFETKANTVIKGTKAIMQANTTANGYFTVRKSFTVANNNINIANTLTPASSSVTMGGKGTLAWDANYLYIEVSANTIKRVALSSF